MDATTKTLTPKAQEQAAQDNCVHHRYWCIDWSTIGSQGAVTLFAETQGKTAVEP